MKIVAVTQARYGSTRLPAKVLKKVGDETLLDIHLQRILKATKITTLVVATTIEEGSDEIVRVAQRNGIGCYRGSINDVLERFYFAVKDMSPDYVVRVTSDCPLIDPHVIDHVITTCISAGCDYASNTLKPTYPDGIDTEVFRFSALERAYNEALLKSEREHVIFLCSRTPADAIHLFHAGRANHQILCRQWVYVKESHGKQTDCREEIQSSLYMIISPI